MSKYHIHKAAGFLFFFCYDEEFPDMLHIYVRHVKLPSDAVRVFFTGKRSWNAKRSRCESFTKREGIYWCWLNEAKRKVLIISCFNRP